MPSTDVRFPDTSRDMKNLFRPPSETIISDISLVMRAIRAATPMASSHERELAYAVRDLSRLLTQDRSQLAQSYWIGKRLLYAYCRYFLPWNLLRLSWLLPPLDIPMPKNGLILDLGSGPMTFPLALWIAKPEWRAMPLTFVCADVSPSPLAVGKEIFKRLDPASPWVLESARAPLEKALAGLGREAQLITAGNVLNEMKPSRETPLEERLSSLARRIAGRLSPGGRFLAMEPGTRLGGKLMALTRLAAFSAHLVPEAPCPHWGPCPMLGARASGWCHFSHTTQGAPKELAALTAKAGLGKEHLSLSCMLLRKATEEEKNAAEARMAGRAEWDYRDDAAGEAGGISFDTEDDAAETYGIEEWAEAYALTRSGIKQDFVRVLSDPIRLPETREPARYGCSVRGLVLAKNALRMPSGAAFAVRWPERDARDAKSGALILELPKTDAEKEAPRRETPEAKHGALHRAGHRAGGHRAGPEKRPGREEERPQNPARQKERGSAKRTRPGNPAGRK